jgi:catechol 2,3-dioxygenase-like lactoylglutathione lyase family enzyme
MTLPTETTSVSGYGRCGCCGLRRPSRQMAELGVTPGVFICASCALWAARRAGIGAALRQIRVRSLLLRTSRRPGAALAAIPILPSADLSRTGEFYAALGFAEAERHDGYLLLQNAGVELHFAQRDEVNPGTCYVHVGDATKLWKQLRDRGVDGVGPIADEEYGLREFAVTDPDGNRVRVGSPMP